MNFMKGLFLPKYPNPTIEVGEHVYRHRDAKDGLVREPITPELKDKAYTVYNVWSSVTEQNARKPAFGWRDLIKVSREWSSYTKVHHAHHHRDIKRSIPKKRKTTRATPKSGTCTS